METVHFAPLTDQFNEEVVKMFLDFYAEDSGIVAVSEKNIRSTIEHWKQFPEAGCIYIFLFNEEVIGYANFIFYWSNEYGGKIVNLDELFVKRAFRKKGIALDFLFKLGELFDKSVVGYELEVHPQNKQVINLYKKAGFSINENSFMLKLTGY